jgi:hypothetical protein
MLVLWNWSFSDPQRRRCFHLTQISKSLYSSKNVTKRVSFKYFIFAMIYQSFLWLFEIFIYSCNSCSNVFIERCFLSYFGKIIKVFFIYWPAELLYGLRNHATTCLSVLCLNLINLLLFYFLRSRTVVQWNSTKWDSSLQYIENLLLFTSLVNLMTASLLLECVLLFDSYWRQLSYSHLHRSIVISFK